MWKVLVYVLIFWPTEPDVSSEMPPEAWAALKQAAQELEVVGPHESWNGNFAQELLYVRNHVHELAGAPHLIDCQRLPTNQQAAEYCCINKRLQEALEMEQTIYPWRAAQIDRALAEARQLHCLWSSVQQATCENESWPNRRQALLTILETTGPEGYYQGRLPAAIPMWCLKDID